jgi:hypothetical protein
MWLEASVSIALAWINHYAETYDLENLDMADGYPVLTDFQ